MIARRERKNNILKNNESLDFIIIKKSKKVDRVERENEMNEKKNDEIEEKYSKRRKRKKIIIIQHLLLHNLKIILI